MPASMRVKSRSRVARANAVRHHRGDIRRKLLQLLEIAARTEQEHAAVPVVLAGIQIGLRARSGRAFRRIELCGTRRPHAGRAGCSHSRFRETWGSRQRWRARRCVPPRWRWRPPGETPQHPGSGGRRVAPATARRPRPPPKPHAPPALPPARYCAPWVRARWHAARTPSHAAARRPESGEPRSRPRWELRHPVPQVAVRSPAAWCGC